MCYSQIEEFSCRVLGSGVGAKKLDVPSLPFLTPRTNAFIVIMCGLLAISLSLFTYIVRYQWTGSQYHSDSWGRVLWLVEWWLDGIIGVEM